MAGPGQALARRVQPVGEEVADDLERAAMPAGENELRDRCGRELPELEVVF